MTLTKKGEYALRAMIQLGIARSLGRGLVSMSELAESNRLPLKFVERIFLELREAGYVETQRGKLGGYQIAKPMDQIRMGELVRLIDGRLAPIACASETEYCRCSCPDEEHCGLRMLMIDVRNAISNILDRYTLGQVVDVTLRKMRRDNAALPFVPEPTKAERGARRIADPAQGFLSQLGIQSVLDGVGEDVAAGGGVGSGAQAVPASGGH
jgi:Rrf2 family protein